MKWKFWKKDKKMANEFKPVSASLQQKRTGIDQSVSIAGGTYRYSKYITINDPGEAIVNIDFPIVFLEKPVFFSGIELDPGSMVVTGGFPVAVPCVRNWLYNVNGATGSRRYVGATILVVIQGVDSQTLLIGCHFEGRALRQPVE